MSTPVKDITYLTGAVYRLAAYPGTRKRIPGLPLAFAAGTVSAPFWLRLQIRDPQYLAVGGIRGLGPFQNVGTSRVMLLETIFWRKRQYRPLRGQLWPLTR